MMKNINYAKIVQDNYAEVKDMYLYALRIAGENRTTGYEIQMNIYPDGEIALVESVGGNSESMDDWEGKCQRIATIKAWLPEDYECETIDDTIEYVKNEFVNGIVDQIIDTQKKEYKRMQAMEMEYEL